MNQILNISPVSMALPGVERALPLVSRIYLGASVPGGGWVGQDAFRAFLEEVVTPTFPEGYTVLQGAGAWLDTERCETIQEASRILEIAHDYEALTFVGYVARLYKERFHQQAVMVSTTQAAVSFV